MVSLRAYIGQINPINGRHISDGEEVFVVLDGVVEMLYRIDGQEKKTTLQAGDIFYASMGTEHVAHPQGEARVLVVETAGSV